MFPDSKEPDLTLYELWVQFYQDPEHRQLVLDSMVRLLDPATSNTCAAGRGRRRCGGPLVDGFS